MTTRRIALLAGLFAAGAPALAAARTQPSNPSPFTGGPNDFDWLQGKWMVRHRRLNGRLVGSTDWQEFDGTSELWLTLGGHGTVDDNWLDIPSGAYRAVGIRAYDPTTKQWAIWWLDERSPRSIETPVFGGFQDGKGTFIAADTLNGKPILVRFRWHSITATTAQWDQAFSPDGGKTWEENWHMDFTKA
jgi:hypothetical protein